MKNLTPPTANTVHEAGLAALPAELTVDSGLAQLPAAMQRLEFISLWAIMELLSSSGALTAENVGRSSDEIINTLGAASRHHWLVRRWLVALVEREFLKLSNGYYSWEQIPESAAGADKLPEAYEALGFPRKWLNLIKSSSGIWLNWCGIRSPLINCCSRMEKY
ncbi:hypothetical protein P3339_12220 [Microbulbifer sp. MLAF003]|uniref:hypothetical protein n=1 Tax=Microbulbifer sp. MLAF003 TaxID=3032582 RepID=UPI0024AD2682|nr:hypothetical protein [Microbulbifer sp. MLAF003]WHI49253.1 hypothetical protein P3339_12220 [Microbulbifer sp. MLAF003]